jgi:hypothetical protein
MESGSIVAVATAVLSVVSVFLGSKYRKWLSKGRLFAELSWSYLQKTVYTTPILTRKYVPHPIHLRQQIPSNRNFNICLTMDMLTESSEVSTK